MALISWGKPKLYTKNADSASAKAYEIPTPVENSTNLTPTKGEKVEAKIEGGNNEDVIYKRSTYALIYNVRKAKNRKAIYPASDGLVSDHYGIMLQPEDDTCEGFFIESSTVSVDDTYTAADGAMWQITHDAVAAQTGDTVKWGTVKVTGEEGAKKVTFTERSSAGSEPFTVTWDLDPEANTNGAAGEPAE